MVLLFPQGINISEPHLSVRRERSNSITFKTWVRFPSAPPRNYMSSILEKKLSILERLPSSRRMREHDEAGKSAKKPINHSHEHFRKDWDKDLWD